MLIAVLLVSDRTLAKLAGRGITAQEVRQVNDGDRILVRNPKPRVAGSLFMIGATTGGRLLTVVLDPTPLDDGVWEVRTAWDASAAQANRYHRDR